MQPIGHFRHLDLFSGIGGFALAAEAAGWNTVGFAEVDDYASRVLKRHWPDVPNYGDVRTVPAVPVDLVTGGFPCQPFSLAGKRAGAADDRYLWPEMLDVVRRCRPAWVLGENVPGIVNMALEQVCVDLEAEGYAVWPLVIPACAVNANHRRDRVWIVAYSAGNRQQGDVWETGTQEPHDGALEALGTQHWNRGPFAHWEKLMGEPGFCVLDDGVSSTVDIRPRLHAYGNAIVPQVAYPLLRWMREGLCMPNEELSDDGMDRAKKTVDENRRGW